MVSSTFILLGRVNQRGQYNFSLSMSVVRPPLSGFNQYQARGKCDLLKNTTNGAGPGLEPGSHWS